jgi:hypothetical protein
MDHRISYQPSQAEERGREREKRKTSEAEERQKDL